MDSGWDRSLSQPFKSIFQAKDKHTLMLTEMRDNSPKGLKKHPQEALIFRLESVFSDFSFCYEA